MSTWNAINAFALEPRSLVPARGHEGDMIKMIEKRQTHKSHSALIASPQFV